MKMAMSSRLLSQRSLKFNVCRRKESSGSRIRLTSQLTRKIRVKTTSLSQQANVIDSKAKRSPKSQQMSVKKKRKY